MKKKTPSNLRHALIRMAALALALLAPVVPAHAGVVLKLQYDAIAGTAVSDLTSAPAFPSSPGSAQALTGGLRAAPDAAEGFGAWTRGYIEAPQTGDYTFWISSDDDSELWLGTDETPTSRVRICQNVGWVEQQSYTIKAAQQSALIPLIKGRKYYFEVLHKEDLYGDHCSVAWRLPDGSIQDPLPSRNLWPFPVDLNDASYPALASKAPAVLSDYLSMPVDALAGTTVVTVGQPVELTVTIEASQPAYVQWFSNSVPIADANLASYRIPVVKLAQDGVVYSVTVTNDMGDASASTTLSVQPDYNALTCVDALNLGNPGGDVVLVFSKPVDSVTATVAGNYGINNGASIVSARMGATPDTVILQTAGMVVGTAYSLTFANIKDLNSPPMTLSSSATPVEQNLNTWLRLDENAGTTATDSSGSGHDGALVNDILPGYAGKVFKAPKFAGVAGHVRLPNGYADYSTNGLTLAAWVNPSTEGAIANWSRIFDLANGAASDNILFARTGGGGTVTFEVYNNNLSSGKVTTPPGTLWINQWQHFMATMDTAGNVVIYRNGVAVASGYTGVPNALMRTNNFIGRSNWGGDSAFTGKMDDVRIYDRVLSAGAALALAAGGGINDSDGSPTVTVVATVPTTALKATPPGVFTVSRTGDTSSALTVQYAMGGTATNGVAYTNLSGTVVLPAGAASANVWVTPIDYSFQGLSQTAILTLKGDAAYLVGDADSAVVSIANNDSSPAAILATADNIVGVATKSTMDVWFAAPVANPSATVLANYTLANAPGVTITGATLGNRNLRVVLDLSGPMPAGAQLSVTGVQDPGGNSVSVQIPVRLRLDTHVNLVANVYHTPDWRGGCYGLAVDGQPMDDDWGNRGFDTWNGNPNQLQFAGLIYGYSQDIQAVKVDLGRQFGDGGNWQAEPYVYLLKNPVDTRSTQPGVSPDWVRVAVPLISGSQFQKLGEPPGLSANSPIVYDLSSLPASQRTCYGWAVGGVTGNGGPMFISIAELRGYGSLVGADTTGLLQQPADLTVLQGQPATFAPVVTNRLIVPAFQWRRDGVDIPGATDNNYNIQAVTLADDGAKFDVVIRSAPTGTPITSAPATLHVLPRTAPAVLSATLDPLNSVIQIWFDESVEAGTAQNLANYTLNDPALTVGYPALNAKSLAVELPLTGTPTVSALTVTVAGIKDLFDLTMGTQVIPVQQLIEPAARIYSHNYNGVSRDQALARSTNGTAAGEQWNTWSPVVNEAWGGAVKVTDFVGLGYESPQVFNTLRVDLGWQFGDGGDWSRQPRVFIQKLAVDSNTTQPETGGGGWVEVPARLVSGSLFTSDPDLPPDPAAAPNSPIVFDLSHLPLDQRIGYAWAIGGVPGNGPYAQFISIGELRGFGTLVSSLDNVPGAPQVVVNPAPATQTLPGSFPVSYQTVVTGTQPLYYQWQRNGVNLSDDTRITGSQSPILQIARTDGSDAGQYQLIVTNALGSNASAIATLALGGVGLNDGDNWMVNGNGSSDPFAGDVLAITSGGFDEFRTAFLNSPLYIRAFRAAYTYEDVGGGGADGAAFVLQNDARGRLAVGGAGGGLGYSGILNSAALEFNIYTVGGVSLRTNGATGGYVATLPVDVRSGHPIRVDLDYDGTTLTASLTDTVTSGSFHTNWTINLPGAVGGDRAYVGFAGASGGVESRQLISDFSFVSVFPPLTIQRAGDTTIVVSWPVSGGSLLLQQAAALPGDWSDVSEAVSIVDGSYQVTLTLQPGERFYRLRLP